jgi:hypothetical protein
MLGGGPHVNCDVDLGLGVRAPYVHPLCNVSDALLVSKEAGSEARHLEPYFWSCRSRDRAYIDHIMLLWNVPWASGGPCLLVLSRMAGFCKREHNLQPGTVKGKLSVQHPLPTRVGRSSLAVKRETLQVTVSGKCAHVRSLVYLGRLDLDSRRLEWLQWLYVIIPLCLLLYTQISSTISTMC